MKIQVLKNERADDFTAYCKKHRKNIDDSFLYDEDLKVFKPDDENPTYILTNSEDQIIGAASLIIDDYNRKGKKGRFRIFHSEVEDIRWYRQLMQGILEHTEGLDKVFLFIPLGNKTLITMMEELAFVVERYSFQLMRQDLRVPEIGLPENYEIRPFQIGQDEEAWCKVRNESFAKLQGNETPVTSEMVAKMVSSEEYIEGGMMILYHKEKPVGVVRGADEEYEGTPIMSIGPLAILPEYQGKGLGRSLLRTSLRFAKEKNYNRTILCVNAENERAKALYIHEGFKQAEAVVCYKYDLR